MRNARFFAILSAATLAVLLADAADALCGEHLKKTPFGTTPDGQAVDLYTLTNASGMQAAITNYGAILVSLKVPDRQGKLGDVVLGFDTLDGYFKKPSYFGAIVGRYGNRIGQGKFQLDGHSYTLAKNNNGQHLHGGDRGFDKVVWNVEAAVDRNEPQLVLRHVSKDGEEGYPGTLDVTVTYTLTDANELKIAYHATTDKPTVVNLTNHSYFNLACGGNILDHLLMIDADRFTPVDKGLITTGELRPVKGTPFDFTKPTAIGARINGDDEQLKRGLGYDHNWVLNSDGRKMTLVARVTEPVTGRVMEILTTEPGLQFYSGNFLDGGNIGKGGVPYNYRCGFCAETQHFPDSPNKPNFPSTVLRPGQTYDTTTIYRFSTTR